jgi:hypothetical protein
MSRPEDCSFSMCSERSRSRGERMFGSVGQQDAALLLEYPWPFGKSCVSCDRLPEAFKERILEERRRSRETGTGLRLSVAMLRQRSRPLSGEIAFWIALPDACDPVLYEFRLDSYEELIAFDIPGVVARASAYDRYIRTEPLFIACTNGRKDPCCARYGMRAYNALVQQVGHLAWQSTHIGGCRFAGNVVCFPHGIYYGHVDPDDVAPILEEYRRQRLYLEKYRGRLSLSLEADVAEYCLRLETGIRELAQFRLVDVQHQTEDRWSARFVSRSTGKIHRVEVVRTRADYEDYLSCQATEQQRPPQYRLIQHEVLAFPAQQTLSV